MKRKNVALYGKCVASGVMAAAATAVMAGTPTITIVYTEIVGDPTASCPGMLDLDGLPVAANFTALFDLAVSHDGSQWVIRADTDLPTTHDQVMLLGAGTVGAPLVQDGQPVIGSTTGELWDFFDSDYPASFDEAGNIAFSGRARPSSTIKEKLVKVIGGVHTIVATESTPVTGLLDVVANPTGDELIGNSVGSVSLLNSGSIFFGNTPIQNCHSSRYPALFIDTVGFMQSGVSAIGAETWDNFGFGDCGMTPDGANWFALGDTENPDTSIDYIFAVNNIKIAQENTALGATGITVGSGLPIFFCRMLANGDWFARGDDTADNDWAISGNGGTWSLVAKTGDPITTPLTGPTENWGNAFGAFHGNSLGDWVLAGNTSNPDTSADNVLVLNGEEVVLREGDPVDLNGNGLPDDDLFINGFNPNDLFITDDKLVHVFVTLRNGAGTNLGDAYLQIDVNPVPPACPADLDGPEGPDGTVGVPDLLFIINAWGPCPGDPDPCPADLDGPKGPDGTVGVPDLLFIINNWGPCDP